MDDEESKTCCPARLSSKRDAFASLTVPLLLEPHLGQAVNPHLWPGAGGSFGERQRVPLRRGRTVAKASRAVQGDEAKTFAERPSGTAHNGGDPVPVAALRPAPVTVQCGRLGPSLARRARPTPRGASLSRSRVGPPGFSPCYPAVPGRHPWLGSSRASCLALLVGRTRRRPRPRARPRFPSPQQPSLARRSSRHGALIGFRFAPRR